MDHPEDLVISGEPMGKIPLIIKKMSVGSYVCEMLKQHGKKIAHIDAVTDEYYTYDQLLHKILQLADALKTRGYRRGDIISISSENRLDYSVLIVAALLLGITVSTINPLYSEGELHHIFSLTSPVAIFCSPFTSGNMIEMATKFPCVREVIIYDHEEDINEPKRIFSYKSVFESGNGRNFEIPDGDFSDDVAVVLMSSGTTGLPKGVMLSHLNIITLLEVIRHRQINLHPNVEQVVIALVPFFHGYGILLMLQSLSFVTELVILPNFDERLFLSSIEKYKVTMLPAVPPLIVFLAKSPLVDEYDLSSLTQIRCGAAPVGKYTLYQVSQRLGISMDSIKQGYGMTEMTILATLATPECPSEAVGKLMPTMKLKVLDLETGQPVGVDKVGELCFHGPLVMKGYIGNLKETQNTIDKEGWIHTGDIGYYDKDHNVYIVDRLKELIKVKGFQVAPAELEDLLTKHPDIQDAAVIGKPDELSGEVPLAFVVMKPNTRLSQKDIETYIANLVSPQKRLKGGVIFVDEIPKNPSGKILRRVLRDSIRNKSKL